MDAKYASVSPRRAADDRRQSRDDLDDLDQDDTHSSSSSTEVDESLLGDEKWRPDDPNHRQGQSSQPRQRRRSCLRAVFTALRWGLDTILLLAILALVVRQQIHQKKLKPPATAKDDYQLGGDFTGVGPIVPQRLVHFKSDQSYAPMNSSEFFTEEVLNKWNQLMPVGMGFVWVNDTHRYHDLPKPIDWPEKTVFTTSVTHQIHCLYTIAQTYSAFKANRPLPDDHHFHMVHCIDYMREAVMCSADMALEGHETTFPDDNGGSDGWDSTHVCKDYSKVKEYLESVRAYDDQLIY